MLHFQNKLFSLHSTEKMTTSFDFHFCSRLFHFAPSSPFFCIVRKMKMFCFSQNVFGTSVTTQMLQTHHCIHPCRGQSVCWDAGKQQKSIVLFLPSRLNPHPPCAHHHMWCPTVFPTNNACLLLGKAGLPCGQYSCDLEVWFWCCSSLQQMMQLFTSQKQS